MESSPDDYRDQIENWMERTAEECEEYREEIS